MREGLANQLGAWLSGFMFLGLLGLTGCAPQSTAKPEIDAGRAGGAARGPSKGREVTTAARDAAPRSSLEALRRGEKPVSGPLKEIYFDFDRYEIRADARDALKANAGWLKANPIVSVEVEGHADERGTNEYNLALGAKRAQVAKDYLVTLGISAARLKTISYGEEVPVCQGHNEECWQKNRRDRFVVTPVRPGT